MDDEAPALSTPFRRSTRQSESREPLGMRARRLQRKILSQDQSLNGRWCLLFHVVLKPLHNLLRIVSLIKLVGFKVKKQFRVPIYRQVLDQGRLVLSTGALPWAYYTCELYRDDGMRHAGELVMRSPMKYGVFKALNRLDPEARNRGRQLGDKVAVAGWCAEAGLPHPHPIIRVEKGDIIWQSRSRGDLDRDLFIKRRDSRGAADATAYRRVGTLEYLDDHGHTVTLDQILAELQRKSHDWDQMVLPLLRNHPAIADLAEHSLITFRVLTCLDEQLSPEGTNLYLRSMAKLEPRWHVGRIQEFAAAIDLKTGKLGRMTGDKPECLSDWFDRHPITGAPVTGRVIPFCQELMQLALTAHSMVPERVLVGWDLAMTESGSVMLEGNSFTDTVHPQRIYQQPIGHMRLGQLMSFHFDRLEDKLAQSPGFFLTK